MNSFTGVNCTQAICWLAEIPYSDWPQQHKLSDGNIRPSMITDLSWRGFGKATDNIENQVMVHFPRCASNWRALSVVMPGHAIETHKDEQPEKWITRVHVPLVTNNEALFIIEGLVNKMRVGQAYRVNTRESHTVANAGLTPRVHLMIDVHSS